MRQNLPVTGRAVDLPRDVNIMSTTTPQSHITYVNPDFIKMRVQHGRATTAAA